MTPFIRLLKKARVKLPTYAVTWKEFQNTIISSKEVNSHIGQEDDIACIFHTSGTTGSPKGAMFTNQACNAMALQGKYVALRFDRGKKMMNQVPPFLAFNILCSLHMPLCRHMQMVLLPDYRPDQFAMRIVKTKATACLAGPADWSNFIDDRKWSRRRPDLSVLVSPISGSDALPLQIKRRINEILKANGCNEVILEGYGMTEIGSAACSNMPGINNEKSVGIPFSLNNFCIYDSETNQEMKYGERGEICMTGATLMKGYYNNADETKKALRKHKDGKVWLHSGDLGYIDRNGFIYIEGRIKRIIVRHDGIKVSPFETEKVIMKHKSVETCCVVGVTDHIYQHGQNPIAFVVLKDGFQEDIEEIERHCRDHLSEKYLPIKYVLCDSLPVTDNGKVNYRLLEKEAENMKNNAF